MTSADPNLDFEALLNYLKQTRSFDFTGYKRSSLMRRVRKRMQAIAIETFSEYIDYLEVHPDEFIQLFNTILINVTTFFRDPSAWAYLETEVIPQIIQHKQPDSPIRLWSVGCASGEEVYTLAILFAEALDVESFRERVKLFATDVDEEALNQARHATYELHEVAGLAPGLREKYFEQVGPRYVFHKELRRSIIFGRHDLAQDAPISRIDLLVCRNTLMYFNTETQTRVLERFHFALNYPGFLLLGKAEMLFTRTNLFTPLNLRERVFGKVSQGNLRERLLLMAHSGRGATANPDNPEVDPVQIREAALNVDPVPQLLISHSGVLLLANQRAQELFGLSLRDLGRPLQDLELSYRPVELRSHIEQVREDLRVITLRDVEWSALSGTTTRSFEVQFIPLLDLSNSLIGIKVLFNDVTRYKQLREELQKTNQELETASEELQSTNEELETMNEEMQSTNEELQAINEELRLRSSELDQVNAFSAAILASLQSGVVVLDRELRIQTWNERAEDLWGLRANEVKGMNFLSLDIGLPVDQLRLSIRDCLAGALKEQTMTFEATNRRGRAIRCQVTFTPLQIAGSEIQGVVLLMEDLEA